MPQFTAESLARVLTQVEREVLSAAAESAGIDPLLTTPRGETLDEMAEWLNFLSNMLVLSPAIDAIAVEETVKDMLGATTLLPPGAIKGIRASLNYFVTLLDKVGILQNSVDSLIVTTDIIPIIRDVLSRLNHVIGELNHTSFHTDHRVMKVEIRASMRLVQDARDILRPLAGG